LYKEMQEMTQARLQACGILDESDSTSEKRASKDPSEMRGRPITTVTRQEMSKAVAKVVTALCVLQAEVSTP
jgi:hypothetical protein